MKPYYQDDSVTLHHGHALKVARELPTGAADCIVTSPPLGGYVTDLLNWRFSDIQAKSPIRIPSAPSMAIPQPQSILATIQEGKPLNTSAAQAISALNITELLRLVWQAGFSQGVYQHARTTLFDHDAALTSSGNWAYRIMHDPIWQSEITEELRVLTEAFLSNRQAQTITGDAAEAIKATVRDFRNAKGGN